MSTTKKSAGIRVIIGYAEIVELPDWGITGVPAKSDTGARSSALHVSDLEILARGRTARFRVVLDRAGKRRSVQVETPVVRRTVVRSSTGHSEERVAVRTTIRLGPVSKEVEVTLTERGGMRYRMLLGRTALAPEFLVDSCHRYTCGRPAKKKKAAKKSRKKKARRT